MSNIKFRAWDKENNKFFEETNRAYVGYIEQLYISPSGDVAIRKMDGMYHESVFPDRFVIQQYSGLDDKHGIPIFEGDIIKSETAPNSIGGTYLVNNLIEFHYKLVDLALGSDDVEVIGNIFESKFE